MKKLFFLLTVVTVFAACKNKVNSIPKNMVLVDTTGLSQSNATTDAAKVNNSGNYTWGSAEKSRNTSHPVYKDNNTTATNTTTTNTTTTTTPAATQATPRDKGWSDAAKGTVIGAGTGAVVGAIVSKDKGKGAIIGTIIGAGAGYAVGRHRDRKSGRVARQRARRAAAN